MCNSVKDISPILKEIFPSAEMASYLARCPFGDDADRRHSQHGRMFDDAPPEKLPLRRYRIANAIAGALISLERKRELFLFLYLGGCVCPSSSGDAAETGRILLPERLQL